MNFRVTAQIQTDSAIANMRARTAELAKYQNQVSSGVRVNVPSDDPNAYVAISQAKIASSRLTTYSQTVSDATATLNSSVSSLQSVNDLLVQARQLAQQGGDSATNGDPTANEALAVQVDGLIDQAIRAGNAQPDGKSIYGGTATGTLPFSVATTDAQGRPATIAYNGSTDRARTLTGQSQTVDTRYVGSAVFQKPGADVFQALISLRDNLRNPALTGTARSQALNQNLTGLDAARTAIGETTGEQSSTLATLEAIQHLTGEVQLTVETRIGELSGTDYTTAVVKMQAQATALQAIFATTSKILQQPDLLSFIR